MMKKMVLAAGAAVSLAIGACPGFSADIPREWREPVKPFRIVGNIYYVGMKGISAYLITSGKQAVLLDGTLEENVPAIEQNIKSLGFELSDIKILINSHAHYDHAAGLAQIKRDSGAALYASEGDKWGLEHGAQVGDITYTPGPFPPVKVDRVVRTGDSVVLGDIDLRATVTAGHTKGCTTWSMRVVEKGRPLDVVFPCGLTVAGNVLVDNKAYPGIAEDFRKTFKTLAGMKADVVLTGHPEQSGVMERQARRQAGDDNAFIDNTLLKQMVAKYQQAFEKDLAKAKAK